MGAARTASVTAAPQPPHRRSRRLENGPELNSCELKADNDEELANSTGHFAAPHTETLISATSVA